MARYRIGNDMTIIWSVTNKDGSSFPLAGKEVHLYYTCERGRFEADIQIQDNVVAWDFAGRDQRVLGGYTLTLEVIQPGGKRIIRKDICNAFTLVGKECEEKDTSGDADINEGGEITLVSELDVYKIQPIIPTVGSNSNWFVDGADTGKPSTGKSAYEYAKEKGYEGTESEYAESLKLAPENAEKLTELSEELGYLTDNPEYIRAYVDANGVFLFGIRTDGSIEWAKGIPAPINKQIENLKKVVAPIAEIISVQGDIENRKELVIDEENKILAYRDESGTKHEHAMNVDNVSVKKSLSMTQEAFTDFEKSLRASGFNFEQVVDWSNDKKIKLPIPRYCAKVNIISKTGLATSKIEDKKCVLEYWDKSGNYFKKYIILNAQGSSSILFIEKNQSIDLYNDESCEDSCEIIFDNWVAQDSFHLKCYYIDVFRGIANVGYNFSEECIQFLKSRNNRVVLDNSATTEYDSTGDFSKDFGDGALCHPDGFPFELYVNGEYYGLFAWNLKKHRKNYSMNKKDYSAVLLDGVIDSATFFGGTIDWTAFELRNPKDLVAMDGGEYDGENPSELIDASSAVYDASNSTHVKTAQTKAHVIRQSNAMAAISSESNEVTARSIYEQYYDVQAMACYFIVSNILYHYDGFRKNWIWALYNSIAAPTFYDMDSIFGRHWNGTEVVKNSTLHIIGTEDNLPTGQLVRLYKSELDDMYRTMREADIISVSNIMRHVYEWMERVGRDAYKNNLDKWASIPSYRSEKTMDDGTAEGGFFDSSKRIELWLKDRIQALDEYFNY